MLYKGLQLGLICGWLLVGCWGFSQLGEIGGGEGGLAAFRGFRGWGSRVLGGSRITLGLDRLIYYNPPWNNDCFNILLGFK